MRYYDNLMLVLLGLSFVADQHIGRCLVMAWTWNHQTQLEDSDHQERAGTSEPGRTAELEHRVRQIFDAERIQPGMEHLFLMHDSDKLEDTLVSYEHKPDCFRDAVALVKARCEEARMDEQERIQAAIGMTMCELATARHYLPPMECAVYARPGTAPWPTLNPQEQARCVDALSRSAQFWSSYSGHLREIPQLCFTFRRWIDIDTAKDIYRNITEEKTIFLRFLLEREKSAKTTQHQWDKMAEGMRDILVAFRSVSNGMRDASDMLSIAILNNSQSLLQDVQNAIQNVADRDRANHGEMVTKADRQKFDSILDGVRREHSDHLLGLLRDVESSITYELSTALALIKDEGLRNLDAAAQLESQLGLLGGGLSAMQDSVEQVVRVMGDASKVLQVSLAQAKLAEAIQGDAMVSMTDLAETVQLLTQTTQDEIAAINRTASALKESLDNRTPSSTEWVKAVFVSLLELFPGTTLVDAMIRFRSLDATFRVVCALWHGVRVFVSFIVSFFILVNARGWLPRTGPYYDREARAQAWMDADSKPRVDRSVRRSARVPQQSFRLQRSRIPDRLCRPNGDAAWP